VIADRPIVAIVGRPNVGKSALFNRLIGKRVAIVEETAGVTRDRLYGVVDWAGRQFTLVDTGGIEVGEVDDLTLQTRLQTQLAIDEADHVGAVLGVVGGRGTGLRRGVGLGSARWRRLVLTRRSGRRAS